MPPKVQMVLTWPAEWNPHHAGSPQIQRRRSERVQQLAEAQAARDAEQAARDAEQAEEEAAKVAKKAAQKKKKRDNKKKAKKRTFEDTDHVEDEDIQFKPAKKQKTQSVFT